MNRRDAGVRAELRGDHPQGDPVWARMDGPAPRGGDDQIGLPPALRLPGARERAHREPIRRPGRNDHDECEHRQISSQKGPGAPQREIGEPSHGGAPYFASNTARHGPCTAENPNP
jgi:hypothetical protein